jgi:hypothetical protein
VCKLRAFGPAGSGSLSNATSPRSPVRRTISRSTGEFASGSGTYTGTIVVPSSGSPTPVASSVNPEVPCGLTGANPK